MAGPTATMQHMRQAEGSNYTFLALGDSYTIGEGVSPVESFPFQTSAILRNAGLPFDDPVVIARTGWTTGELTAALDAAAQPGPDGKGRPALDPPYDLVSLLIGVNDQYRGLSLNEYDQEFRRLLERAVALTGNRPARTMVLSIPDWSVSPFASVNLPDAIGRDKATVARQIDTFNEIARRHARQCGTSFVGITEHTRASLPSGFVSDGLHPRGSEIRFWAQQVARRVREVLGQ